MTPNRIDELKTHNGCYRNMMKFVVARYNENVDWTNGLSNCMIYNKGTDLPNSIHPVVSLPNVGREGHTYLMHIIHNYDNLDDYTCFLQGNPFDHTPNLESRIKLAEARPVEERPAYEILSNHIYSINLCYDPTDFSLHALLIDTYQKVFGVAKSSHEFRFGAGAQFIVSRDAIQSRPKSFYERIVPLLDYTNCPAEGFAMERFWAMIFTHSE